MRPPIHQGDIYWVKFDAQDEIDSDIPHPQIVLQDDVLNHSRIVTVVVCGLTSNLGRAHMPGNLLLEPGEGNLPRQSVVEVSKVSSVPKAQLGAYIGSLSAERVAQIFAGMRLLQRSFFTR
jgi:mRNA interferase MazF